MLPFRLAALPARLAAARLATAEAESDIYMGVATFFRAVALETVSSPPHRRRAADRGSPGQTAAALGRPWVNTARDHQLPEQRQLRCGVQGASGQAGRGLAQLAATNFQNNGN